MKSPDPISRTSEPRNVAIVSGENLKVDGWPMRAGRNSGTGSKPGSRIREPGLAPTSSLPTPEIYGPSQTVFEIE
jgi:hypothetical protein